MDNPLEMARAAAAHAPRDSAPELNAAVTGLWADSIAAWSLLSIAASLAEIAQNGIETYQLDGDGHRL